MRGRIWIFAVLVAVALVLQLALLSARVAQNGEDNVRARLAQAGSALHAQLELLDARLSPRAVASAPDLIEATRPPADPTQPLTRPDERALRAAASALSPEPDLIAVVNGQGAIVSRRAKAAQGLDDASPLPLAKAALSGSPAPAFATWDGGVYRVAAARVPGDGAAAVVGTLVDDRLAAQLKSQVDADVTLLQGGKVLASSLPQGDERARLLRWAAAPSPGYGVLQVRLPGIGTALSGRLPRGASRYAVRGALVPLDSGVQAALTVSAAPYLGWLGRYQAFYAAALALFVLFSLIYGLLARAPARVVVERVAEPAPAPRPARATPSLLGTDVGEPRATPAKIEDVPWSAGEAPEVVKAAPPARILESLDPELPPPPKSSEPDEAHAMWSADPFTPTPAPVEAEPEPLTAEEAGLVESEPTPEPGPAPAKTPPPPPVETKVDEVAPHEAEPAQAEGQGGFSFAGLLQDSPALDEPQPSLAELPDTTAPGGPSDELLAESRREEPPEEPHGHAHGQPHDEPEPFPGDEPTRIEPVSAALLDKLRERDEELSQAKANAAADQGWDSLVPEPQRTSGSAASVTEDHVPAGIRPEQEQHEPAPPSAAAPEASVTMQDFSLPALEAQDPDEAHWRETYDRFKELKAELGEPADKIGFEKFAAKLRKNRADLVARHNCKGVRFSVYEKDGKAAIKATAVR